MNLLAYFLYMLSSTALICMLIVHTAIPFFDLLVVFWFLAIPGSLKC